MNLLWAAAHSFTPMLHSRTLTKPWFLAFLRDLDKSAVGKSRLDSMIVLICILGIVRSTICTIFSCLRIHFPNGVTNHGGCAPHRMKPLMLIHLLIQRCWFPVGSCQRRADWLMSITPSLSVLLKPALPCRAHLMDIEGFLHLRLSPTFSICQMCLRCLRILLPKMDFWFALGTCITPIFHDGWFHGL